MRILITGGAGFIGGHLTKKLLGDGHSVRWLDNLLPQVHGSEPKVDADGVEFLRGDVRNDGDVRKAVEGVDVVYHLAAETGVGQSQYEIERYIATNTYGTAVVLQEAVKGDVSHVIIISSRAVYGEGIHLCTACDHRFVPDSRSKMDLERGDWEIKCVRCGQHSEAQTMKESDPMSPISIYGLTKVQNEQTAGQVAKIYPTPVTCFRPFNVYGPGQSLSNPYVGVLGTFFRRISAGEGIDIYEDGQMKRDFVYVGDVAEVLRLAGRNERVFNEAINVGSGRGVTLEEAGREMFSLFDAEPRIDFSGKYRLGDIHHAVGTISLLEEKLGYTPQTTFREGLKKFVEWARNESVVAAHIDAEAEKLLRQNNLLGQVAR